MRLSDRDQERAAALAALLKRISPLRRAQAAEELLKAFDALYHHAELAPPPWINGLRSEAGHPSSLSLG